MRDYMLEKAREIIKSISREDCEALLSAHCRYTQKERYSYPRELLTLSLVFMNLQTLIAVLTKVTKIHEKMIHKLNLPQFFP